MSRFALALVVVGLTGCATPAKIADAEKASIDAVRSYGRNADKAVDALLDAYRQSTLETLDLLAEMDIREAAADGQVTVEHALQVLALYREKVAEIDAQVDSMRRQWVAASAELDRALKLRALIHDWLTRPGLDADDVHAFGRALEAELGRLGG